MLYLAQVNFGTNSVSILGILYVCFGIPYFIFMIAWLARHANRLIGADLALYLLQIIFIPIFMGVHGFILIFQGWRLDPILQFGETLSFLMIIYLIIKDIVFNSIFRNR